MDRPQTPPRPGQPPHGEESSARGGSQSPPIPQTVREMQVMARAFLERKGLAEARLEADLLVSHALGLQRLGMLLQLDRPLDRSEVDRARDALVRRARREPVAYITGEREFYGRPFHVGPGVLIPRPETEGVVDVAKDWAKQGLLSKDFRGLDLGTGSGCLAITLQLELPASRWAGVDRSPKAMAWAQRNAGRHGPTIDWITGDGFEAAARLAPLDLLVSNPPYVRRADLASMDPEVHQHEPHEALFAPDDDPDAFLRWLVQGWDRFMAPKGRMLIELGYDQGSRVPALIEPLGLRYELVRDLARIDRIVAVWR